MAIKLNGKDLKKRIINGREVGRVVLNGVQIRPVGPTPINEEGIYWSQSLGLITIGKKNIDRLGHEYWVWHTMADKNLGATQVYNSGDTLSQSNCGNIYQWGNCYGFPYTGPTKTMHDYVDTTGYGPGNYYSSDEFVVDVQYYLQPKNTNLWGNDTGTDEARRGPCPEGFHIPTSGELIGRLIQGSESGIMGICAAFGLCNRPTGNTNTAKLSGLALNYLKLPPAGYVDWTYRGSLTAVGDTSFLWTSSAGGTNYTEPTGCRFTIGEADYGGGYWLNNSSQGFSIRPFKNEVVMPDNTRTVLYQPNS